MDFNNENALYAFTSKEIVDWYNIIQAKENEKEKNKATFYLEELFPNRNIMSETVKYFLGKEAQNVALKASAYDTDPTVRDRTGLKTKEIAFSFFREEMRVTEAQYIKIATLDPKYKSTVTSAVFDDFASLIKGARISAEIMRASLITTGKTHLVSNGVDNLVDYELAASQKVTPTVKWTSAATAKPITDLIDWVESQDYEVERILMNKTTWNYIVKSDQAKDFIQSTLQPNIIPTSAKVKQYIINQLDSDIEIVIYNESYQKKLGGAKIKYIPDGIVSLSIGGTLGSTCWGITPAEAESNSDKIKVAPRIIVQTLSNGEVPAKKREFVSANIGIAFPLQEYVVIATVN